MGSAGPASGPCTQSCQPWRVLCARYGLCGTRADATLSIVPSAGCAPSVRKGRFPQAVPASATRMCSHRCRSLASVPESAHARRRWRQWTQPVEQLCPHSLGRSHPACLVTAAFTTLCPSIGSSKVASGVRAARQKRTPSTQFTHAHAHARTHAHACMHTAEFMTPWCPEHVVSAARSKELPPALKATWRQSLHPRVMSARARTCQVA